MTDTATITSSSSSQTATRHVGQVKWFDKSKGYGFVTNMADKVDYFVHHSALKVQGVDEYAYLVAGEYIEFELSTQTTTTPDAQQGRLLASNVSGVNGGSLMYKTIKSTRDSSLARNPQQSGRGGRGRGRGGRGGARSLPSSRI